MKQNLLSEKNLEKFVYSCNQRLALVEGIIDKKYIDLNDPVEDQEFAEGLMQVVSSVRTELMAFYENLVEHGKFIEERKKG